MRKKLIRPKQDRVFFGVAAAIADYLEIDTAIIRIIFVLLTLWGGIGLIIYIIGIFVIPEEETTTTFDKKNKKEPRQVIAEDVRIDRERKENSPVLGIILLVIGLFFLLNNFLPRFNFFNLWPLILVAIGIAILFGERSKS